MNRLCATQPNPTPAAPPDPQAAAAPFLKRQRLSVSADGRHRTVVCRLVAGGIRFGRTGLMGWWPCPLSSWTARSLVRRLRYGLRRTGRHVGGLGLPGGVGGSPAAILWSQPGTPSP